MWSWVVVAFRRRRGTVAVVCGLQLSIPRSSTFVSRAAMCKDRGGVAGSFVYISPVATLPVVLAVGAERA